MAKQVELVFLPEEAANEQLIKKSAADFLNISETEISNIQVSKRSIDARSKNVLVRLKVNVFFSGDSEAVSHVVYDFPNVKNLPEVAIIGAGPAGLFAALTLIRNNIKPIIFERGKDVRSRRRDLASINKEHIVNPNSNYCFGEGGAGTYSDGKLYTRSVKRGNVEEVLQLLVQHGATPDILIDAHPHIGTNKLPKVVSAIRKTIIDSGGEIFFNTHISDFEISGSEIKKLFSDNVSFNVNSVILATGHSARDIFKLFHRKKLSIEAKPFALGVRIEHPQKLIDEIQYKVTKRSEYLPAASYSLTCQVDERGIYSFCMCPGGFMVPAATSPGEVVLNGMSPSKRNSKFANSGMVVTINKSDAKKYGTDSLSLMKFQEEVERIACVSAGGIQSAPAQRVVDFINKKVSKNLPESSYQPGLTSVDLDLILPDFVSSSLRDALKFFGKKMKGYITNEAVMAAVESRTSSPVRIPRHKDLFYHVQLKNLFPCGEGAGYAGGIVSAALDGVRCAIAAVTALKN